MTVISCMTMKRSIDYLIYHHLHFEVENLFYLRNYLHLYSLVSDATGTGGDNGICIRWPFLNPCISKLLQCDYGFVQTERIDGREWWLSLWFWLLLRHSPYPTTTTSRCCSCLRGGRGSNRNFVFPVPTPAIGFVVIVTVIVVGTATTPVDSR